MIGIKRYDELIGEFLVLLLTISIVLDPTDQWFHLKVPLFILCFFYNLKSKQLSSIWIPIVFFIVFFVTYLFQKFNYFVLVNLAAVRATFKTFLFSLLVVGITNKNKTKLFKAFFVVVLFQSSFCVFLSLLLRINYQLATRIISLIPNTTYGYDYNFMVTQRSFIGIELFGIYYKTSPLATLALAFSSYIFLFYKKKQYLIYSLIFILFLFFSSTRANVLAALIIPSFMIVYFLIIKKRFVLAELILIILMGLALILFLKFVSDKGDFSLNIKALHRMSYKEIFQANPLRYVFVGEGPGSLFFTKAVNEYWTNTELSYYDLIRNYGLVFSIIIMLVFLFPLLKYCILKNKALYISVSFGYIVYLLIAATNPYLLSSTGFFMYTIVFYISKIDPIKEVEVCFQKKNKWRNILLKFNANIGGN